MFTGTLIEDLVETVERCETDRNPLEVMVRARLHLVAHCSREFPYDLDEGDKAAYEWLGEVQNELLRSLPK